MQPHPPLLKVNGPAAVAVVDQHLGLHVVIGHRQECHARLPALAELLGHGRQRQARLEHFGAHDVRREVAVAQGEPVWDRPP